jgi:NTP pyrophosphatase (non-canonical NTP hydrolase)
MYLKFDGLTITKHNLSMDQETTIESLKNQVKTFCEAREWDQFHSLKDLAIGVSTEANELLELFRFINENEIDEKLKDPVFKNRVEQELADVFFFILRIAQKNHLDLTQVFSRKMRSNAEKYPVEKARASNKKYNE